MDEARAVSITRGTSNSRGSSAAGQQPNVHTLSLAFAACVRSMRGGARSKRRRPLPVIQLQPEAEPIDQSTERTNQLSEQSPFSQITDLSQHLLSKQNISRHIAIINGKRVGNVEIKPDTFVRFDICGLGTSVLLPRSGKQPRQKRNRVRVHLGSILGTTVGGTSLLDAVTEDGESGDPILTFDLQTLLYRVAVQRHTRTMHNPPFGSSHRTSDALAPIPNIERPYIDDEPIVIRRYCALPCEALNDRELKDRCYCWHLARYVAMIS